MALVPAPPPQRSRAADAARWAPAGPVGENVFGTMADACDPETQSFLFTRRRDVLDGYLAPAVALALSEGLDRVFDAWTHGALQAVLETEDLLSKRMLWLALLTLLPQVEGWFMQKGGPHAAVFVAHAKREMQAFCLGQTREPPEAAPEARPAKRGRRATSDAAPPCDPLYASPADFVSAMTAYFLAL